MSEGALNPESPCLTTEALRERARLIVKVLGDLNKEDYEVNLNQAQIRDRYRDLRLVAFSADAAEQARTEWVMRHLMVLIDQSRKDKVVQGA